MNQSPRAALSQVAAMYLPYGSIKRLSDFKGKIVKKLASKGEIPVLAGHFNSKMFGPAAGQPQHIGWGSLRTAHPALTCRLQVGPDMLYWVVNAADPEVWAMLEAWHNAKEMVVAAEFDDATAVVATCDFKLRPQMLALRPGGDPRTWMPRPKEFLAQAGDLLLKGELARQATTDIPKVSSLRYVQACTVETESTGRALVPLEMATSAMCNLIMPAWGVELAPTNKTLH